MLAALAPIKKRCMAEPPGLLCREGQLESGRAAAFAQAGCGFDIVSAGELSRVPGCWGSASKVVFSGVGKTRTEMAMAMKAGVKCFNVESFWLNSKCCLRSLSKSA